MGPALPGVELKIAGDGEILTRGPNNLLGYLNDPAATAAALDEEGFLHTGDVGYLDADGFLYITDRKKDIIITAGGENVTPSLIEVELKKSPAHRRGRRHRRRAALPDRPDLTRTPRRWRELGLDAAGVRGGGAGRRRRGEPGRGPGAADQEVHHPRASRLSIERGELTPTLR